MPKSLSDIVTAPAIAAYWDTLVSNTIPYLGPSLFPAKRMQGLKLDWIKGKDSLPVQLHPSNFDTKPTLRDRGGVTKVGMKMPFFREAMRIGEEDRQELLQALRSNDPYIDGLVTRIYDDASTLIAGAQANPEAMIFQILQSGKFTISSSDESGQDVTYDYDYDPDNTWAASNIVTLSGADAWGTGTAHPLNDILALKRKAATNGTALTRAIVSAELWGELLTDPAIGKDVFPLATDTSLSDSELQQYLLRKTGIQFTVYLKQYEDTNKTAHPFVDANKVILLPSSPIGTTFYGTTPEEADLMNGQLPGANVSVVDGGISVLTMREALPVNVITSVSEIVLPSFEGIDSVYVIKAK